LGVVLAFIVKVSDQRLGDQAITPAVAGTEE
jgi:hypothetical protein